MTSSTLFPISLLKTDNSNDRMTSRVTNKELKLQLDEINQKLNALLVREEPATKAEQKALREGKKEFAQGKFVTWESLRTRIK